MKTCTYGECQRPHFARGLCCAHYKRKRRGADMEAPMRQSMSPEERFWSRVDKSGDCWMWTASRTEHGYGRFTLNGEVKRAHRVSFELHNGEIPEGLVIDHLCHTPPCVNPSHLRLATYAENSQNLSGAHRDSSSGVRGVSWYRSRGKWRAQAVANGQFRHLGYFSELDEAERAVSEWWHRLSSGRTRSNINELQKEKPV